MHIIMSAFLHGVLCKRNTISVAVTAILHSYVVVCSITVCNVYHTSNCHIVSAMHTISYNIRQHANTNRIASHNISTYYKYDITNIT